MRAILTTRCIGGQEQYHQRLLTRWATSTCAKTSSCVTVSSATTVIINDHLVAGCATVIAPSHTGCDAQYASRALTSASRGTEATLGDEFKLATETCFFAHDDVPIEMRVDLLFASNLKPVVVAYRVVITLFSAQKFPVNQQSNSNDIHDMHVYNGPAPALCPKSLETEPLGSRRQFDRLHPHSQRLMVIPALMRRISSLYRTLGKAALLDDHHQWQANTVLVCV